MQAIITPKAVDDVINSHQATETGPIGQQFVCVQCGEDTHKFEVWTEKMKWQDAIDFVRRVPCTCSACITLREQVEKPAPTTLEGWLEFLEKSVAAFDRNVPFTSYAIADALHEIAHYGRKSRIEDRGMAPRTREWVKKTKSGVESDADWFQAASWGNQNNSGDVWLRRDWFPGVDLSRWPSDGTFHENVDTIATLLQESVVVA